MRQQLIGVINYGDRGAKGKDGVSIVRVDVNDNGTLTFVYDDGTSFTTEPLHITQSSEWDDVTNKPFESLGDDLIVEDGVLKIDKTNEVQADNTKPITSAGVHMVVGNIDALLETI